MAKQKVSAKQREARIRAAQERERKAQAEKERQCNQNGFFHIGE